MAQIFPYTNVTFEDYHKFLQLDTILPIYNKEAENNLINLIYDWSNIYNKQWDDIKTHYFGITDKETLSFVDMSIIWILSTGNVMVKENSYNPTLEIGSCNTKINKKWALDQADSS